MSLLLVPYVLLSFTNYTRYEILVGLAKYNGYKESACPRWFIYLVIKTCELLYFYKPNKETEMDLVYIPPGDQFFRLHLAQQIV